MNKAIIQPIKYVFYLYYAFIIASIGFFFYQIVLLGNYSEQFNEIGTLAGTTAVYLFIATLLPGMLGRFGINNVVLTTMRFFRGNIGIAMFLEALMHYLLVKIFPMILSGKIVLLLPFEVLGFFALQIAFLMTLTSSKFAMRKMGKWWKRLHSLTYILVWLLFGHVVLQEVSVTSVLLGVVAVVEVISLNWKRIFPLFGAKISNS